MDHHGKQITVKYYDEAKMRTRQERVATDTWRSQVGGYASQFNYQRVQLKSQHYIHDATFYTVTYTTASKIHEIQHFEAICETSLFGMYIFMRVKLRVAVRGLPDKRFCR